MFNIMIPALGAGVGYMATKTDANKARNALVAAGIAAAAMWLINPEGISQHYTWQRYIRPGYNQPYLRSMGPQFDEFGVPDRVSY